MDYTKLKLVRDFAVFVVLYYTTIVRNRGLKKGHFDKDRPQ